MKKIIAIILFSQTALAAPPSRSVDHAISNSLSVGTTAVANSKSVVDMVSTTKGMLPPRMTSTQRDAIATPPTGLVIYNTTTAKLNQYNGTAWVDVGSGSSGGGGTGINLISDLNFDFEQGTSGWTASGGSFTIASSGTNLIAGTKSGVFNASASGQTLSLTSITVTSSNAPGIAGGNGYAACLAKGAATDYKLQVFDGTNVLSERVIPALSSAQEIGLYFVIPTSGTIALRAISQSDAADQALDNCFMGAANVISVSQAKLATAVKFEYANCESWLRNSTSLGAFTADTDCGPPQVVESGFLSVSSTDTDLPKVTLLNAPAGTYIVRVTASVVPAVAQEIRLAVNDGTNSRGVVNAYLPNVSNTTSVAVEAPFSYSSPADRTFEIFGSTPSGGNLTLRGGLISSTGPLNVTIYYYPPAAEQAIKPDQLIQSWTGYHDNTCAWSRTNAAYGDPAADATCGLTTRLSTNLTVTSALSGSDKLPGVVINASMARKFRVCATPKMYTDASTQFLDARLTDGTTVIAEWHFRGGATNQVTSFRQCGIYQAVVGENTLKIQLASSAGTASINPTGTALPLAAIEWDITADDTPQAAPLLVGSVTSSSNGLERVERAKLVLNSGSSSVLNSSSNWISFGSWSSPNYTFNISASSFTSAPTCQCTIEYASATASTTNSYFCNIISVSTSSLVVMPLAPNGGASGAATLYGNISCQGPR